MVYDNTNTFILAKNQKRETEKHPEYTGTVNVDGVEYYLNGWVKERKDGTGKFISGSIKPKNPKPKPADDFIDDLDGDNIPF